MFYWRKPGPKYVWIVPEDCVPLAKDYIRGRIGGHHYQKVCGHTAPGRRDLAAIDIVVARPGYQWILSGIRSRELHKRKNGWLPQW